MHKCRFNRHKLQESPRSSCRIFPTWWDNWPKILSLHIQKYVMTPFPKIFTPGWINQDLLICPVLLWDLSTGPRTSPGTLTNEFGGSFGSPPKVLRMTIGQGPCCKASGHSGSKTAKTIRTSIAKMAKWGQIFWPKMGSILIFICIKNFWAWFQSGTSQWRVLAALRKRVIFFHAIFCIGISRMVLSPTNVTNMSKFWPWAKFSFAILKIWEKASWAPTAGKTGFCFFGP